MSIKDYTTERKKGKHLSLNERGKIEAYLKLGKTKKYISKELGVSERTIYREIKRGKTELLNSNLTTRIEYLSDVAHRKYKETQSKKGGYLKIGSNHKLAQFIEDKIIIDKYSPYATLILAKKEFKEDVNFCLKTLYNYIHSDLFLYLNRKHLIYKKKRKAKTKIGKRVIKKGGKSIETRSSVINNREELGHWEMDTVVGGIRYKACLLVLTERFSRKERIIKLNSKNSYEVVNALKSLKKELGENFTRIYKTITSDNGSEFSKAEEIESLGIEYFYAHSYCSHERGSNENNNKLIRRFIPKSTDISIYTKEEIKEIEIYMNNYPRKIFNGLSANEVYDSFYDAS